MCTAGGCSHALGLWRHGHRVPAGREGVVRPGLCSVCHSLSGRESPRRQGGDLLDFHANRTVMLQFAGEMPVRHRLGPVQLRTVADYVIAVERRGR